MIKIIEKAVEKVAAEWVEQQFTEMYLHKVTSDFSRNLTYRGKLREVVENVVDQKIKEITLQHLEKEKIDIKQIVIDRLATVKDKIEITVKTY